MRLHSRRNEPSKPQTIGPPRQWHAARLLCRPLTQSNRRVYLCMQTHVQVSRGATTPFTFLEMVRREGFLRLWRGAPAVMIGCVPSHAAYFSVYEAAKHRLGVDQPGHHPLAAALTGAASTITHDGVLTPMDVVKQRLQLGYYKGVFDCLSSIVKEEGVRALWRSYPTTLTMNIPYAAVVVAANESFKKVWIPITGVDSIFTYLVSGAGAGAIAGFATTPMDLIKTRLQTMAVTSLPRPGGGGGGSGSGSGGASSSSAEAVASGSASAASDSASTRYSAKSTPPTGEPRVARPAGLGGNLQVAMLYTQSQARQRVGAVDIAKAIWREEGPAAFFKGARARMAVHMPSQAISWAVYEMIKAALARQFGNGRNARD